MKILFGVVGMLLVQGSTILQVIKFFRFKRTEGVSVGFWWAVFIGLLFYLVYAILIQDTIYIISNIIGSSLSGWTIYLYYYYKSGRRWRKNKHALYKIRRSG